MEIYCKGCRKLKDKSQFKILVNNKSSKSCLDCLDRHFKYFSQHKEELTKKKKLYNQKLEVKIKNRNKHNREFAKIRIGRLIKDELMLNPKSENKSLWNGIGKWHHEFFDCLECNTTIYKHKANGVCRKCYRKLYYDNNHLKEKGYTKQYRKENPEKVQETKNKWRKRARAEADKFIDIAKNKKADVTPKIKNLLNNLEL